MPLGPHGLLLGSAAGTPPSGAATATATASVSAGGAAVSSGAATAQATALIQAGSVPAPTVFLLAGGMTSLNNAQWAVLASWGVTAVVFSSEWPNGFGGSTPFDGTSGNTVQNQWAATAVLAHNHGIKVYLGIYLQNFFWGQVSNTNPGPMLGAWDPSFTDKNGKGYGASDGSTPNSWYQMCLNYGAAVAQMGLDGMFWDTEGGGMNGAPAQTRTSTAATANTITISTANASAVAAAANGSTIHVTGPGITAPVTATVNTGTGVCTLTAGSGGAIGTLSASGSYVFTFGPSFMIWQWRFTNNGYGASSSQAQEFAWAQTVGANMMACINAGFAASGGVGGCPIYLYQSTVAGLPQFQNGYLDVFNTFNGNTAGIFISGSGTVATPYHTAIGYSTWTSFMVGVASQTTAPVVCGDSTFYAYQEVTSGGPYSADADGGWKRALEANQIGLAGLGLPSNVASTPFIWPYDSSAGNAGAGVWNQTVWNQAKGPIFSGYGGGCYMIFQFTSLLSGSTLVTDYTNNPNSSPSGANYTPLNGQSGVSGSAAVTAQASVSASGIVTQFGVASPAGAATITASGIVTQFGAASPAGIASVSASGTTVVLGVAAPSATANVTTSGTVVVPGAAAPTASASVSANGLVTVLGAAAAAAMASVNVSSSAGSGAIVTITATVGAGGTITQFATAAAGATTSVNAGGIVVVLAAAAVTVTASITVTPSGGSSATGTFTVGGIASTWTITGRLERAAGDGNAPASDWHVGSLAAT